jgi:hypothetical protein
MIYNCFEKLFRYRLRTFILIGCLIYCFGCGYQSNSSAQTVVKKNAAKKEKAKSMEKETDKNPTDVILKCKITPSEDKITLTYSVENQSGKDIYLLDAHPRYDEESKKRVADYKSFYLSSHDSSGFLLKGIPPLPEDKMVAMRIMPLGTKITSKQKIERTLELDLPLKEQNPWYYAPLEDEKDYEKTTITHLIVEVHFMRSTVEDFKAVPALFAPELFNVSSKFTLGTFEKLRSTIDLTETVLLRRTDVFTRL